MKIRCKFSDLVAISELKLNPNNRNIHSREQIQRLADILKYQGWRYPVKVSNQSGMVTSGHGRVEAALVNGWTEVPIDFQDYDNWDQEYADTIADNAIASWAELNITAIEMDIKHLNTSFDIQMLGMQSLEIETKSEQDKSEKVDLNQQWICAVACTSEPDLQTVYEEMISRGYSCKLIM